MPECWLGRRVRDVKSGQIGIVTGDLQEPDDMIAVDFGLGQWNSYVPNQWSKDHLFELLPDEPQEPPKMRPKQQPESD